MYMILNDILSSDLFEYIYLNTYLKLRICVVCREFLAFKYVFIVIFETNQMIIYNCTSEILQVVCLKPVFSNTISICIFVGN